MIRNRGYRYREQIGPEAAGQSILSYLSASYRHSERGVWAARLARGEVLLGGVTAQGDEVLRAGQWLVWHRPPWREAAVPLHYSTIYQDAALLVVDKPSGLPTLPAGGFLEHTLLTLVRSSYPEAIALHRLGRATSGLVLFVRTPELARRIGTRWRTGVQKGYRALASGVAAADHYDIAVAIGPVAHPRLGSVHAASETGKPARSLARVTARGADTTMFAVELVTGRPHQIRIHLAAIGHPLLGDPMYARGGQLRPAPGLPGEGGYLLHAEHLALTHPVSGERLRLRAPLPAGFPAF